MGNSVMHRDWPKRSLCWLLGLGLLGCAQRGGTAELPESAPAVPPAAASTAVRDPVRRFQLADSEVRTLASPETGRDYSIVVRLPASFSSEPEKRYPVLYLLDAQWNFELLNRIVANLLFDQVIPEVLVVGITYSGDSPDYDSLRRQDFLPTEARAYDGKICGGGAEQFLEFLEKRVIPLAETEYRAAPDHRVISGASYGGLFVLYALFKKPGLFHGYLSMSPAVVWDSRWIFAQEQAFRERASFPKVDVWLSVGSAEWPEYVAANQEFFQRMEQGRRPETRLVTRTIEGEGHAGNLPEAHTRSLRFIFEDWLVGQKAARPAD